MGFWPGKYVIGLTGSIGTGKSVVRHMLEQMGALGIDADTLAHRVYARGTAGIEMIRQTFGEDMIGADGEVDRLVLAQRVFQDGKALAALERIVHPLVIDLVNALIERAPQKMIVVEAIKLLETELASHCDAVWVVATSPEVQLQRLVQERHMSEEAARTRIDAQLSQEERIRLATVVIPNDGSLAETWQQVRIAWEQTLPVEYRTNPGIPIQISSSVGMGDIRIAGLADIEDLTAFFSGFENIPDVDLFKYIIRNTIHVLRIDEKIRAALVWHTENLVACGLDFHIQPGMPLDEVFQVLVTVMEIEARRRLCEVSVFPSLENNGFPAEVFTELGYELTCFENIQRLAWKEQLLKTMNSAAQFYLKALS